MRKENLKELKNNKKVKMTMSLTKVTLYFILVALCFKYSIIIANNIIFGLQQIVLWGTDNMTKLVFGILVAIVTIVMFRKSK
jgi:hypothetical protein